MSQSCKIVSSSFYIYSFLDTLYKCSLTTVAQDRPYHEKPLISNCCNHKGSCTLFRPRSKIADETSSSIVWVSMRQLAVSSLFKGISSTFNFHQSTGTDGTRTQPHAPKASTLSIELTWFISTPYWNWAAVSQIAIIWTTGAGQQHAFASGP